MQADGVRIRGTDAGETGVDPDPIRAGQLGVGDIIVVHARDPAPQQRWVNLCGDLAEDITGNGDIESESVHRIDDNIFLVLEWGCWIT